MSEQSETKKKKRGCCAWGGSREQSLPVAYRTYPDALCLDSPVRLGIKEKPQKQL
jgi:hypothetical protein